MPKTPDGLERGGVEPLIDGLRSIRIANEIGKARHVGADVVAALIDGKRAARPPRVDPRVHPVAGDDVLAEREVDDEVRRQPMADVVVARPVPGAEVARVLRERVRPLGRQLLGGVVLRVAERIREAERISFRESPLALAALEKLSALPDLLMVDGQGLAHPRRIGIASHLGLLLDCPTIGVAKSILTGHYENLGENAGDTAPLVHRGQVIGTAVRSKPRTNPLIVSIGHKIDLDTAVGLVMRCLRGYRLPEPTRRAHNLAAGQSQVADATPPPADTAQPTLF